MKIEKKHIIPNKKHIIIAAFIAAGGSMPMAQGITAYGGAMPAVSTGVPGMEQPREINAADAEGYLTRATIMEQEENYRGAADQIRHALEFPLSQSARESAEFRLATVSAHIPEADAIGMFRNFLANYPSSTLRQQALLGIADCLYDSGSFGEALSAYNNVDAEALQTDDALRRDYRRAYCLLKLTRYDEAGKIYSRLSSSKKYSAPARFYQGYIAYVKGDLSKAEKLFTDIATLRGEPCNRAPYYLAQIYFARKEYAKAERSASQLLKNPAIPGEYRAETERIIGESLYHMGRPQEAMPRLKRYLELADTPLPSALYLMGVEEYNEGRYEEALRHLTPVADELSTLGQSACLYIGQTYLKQENYDAASMALQKACRLDFDAPTREMAYYNYAVAHLKGGRTPFGSSVALFEDFLLRYPDSSLAPQVQDYVVSGYVDDNNYKAALEALDHIRRPSQTQLKARQQVLYLLGTREFQSGDIDEALSHLRQSKELSKHNPALGAETSLWIGECLYRKGEYRQADSEFTSFLKSGYAKGANESLAYYDRGYGRFAIKEFNAARADFEKFLRMAPNGVSAAQRADALNRIGDCRYYSRDFAAAADTYARALSTEPASGDYPMYQQGMMKGLSGDHAAKIEILNGMVGHYPSSALVPSAMLETAESYAALERNDRALEIYNRVADTYPSSEQGRRSLLLSALTYLNMGDTHSAKARYRDVISRYPSSEEARAAADDLKHIAADEGTLSEYSSFLASVPDAPKLERGEMASLLLESARKAAEEGRHKDAIARAAEIADTYPDAPEAVSALAIKASAEEESGMAPRALETYRLMAEKASSAADANTATLGIMRLSQDMGEYAEVIRSADRLLTSSAIGADVKTEATFAKALALAKSGDATAAISLWESLSDDPESLWGAKSLYYMAQEEFNRRNTAKAEKAVNRLINANPPHDYWLARGFILLSDIRASQGNRFEAEEYLRSLRENYPGKEADIMQMIDSRLSDSKNK